MENLKRPISFITTEDDIYNLNKQITYSRGILNHSHIADIHFGALDPKVQYEILKEQFIDRLSNPTLKLDILSIDGDLFDHKFMSNSNVIMYATMFFNDCVNLCRIKGATLILIHGTLSHDEKQLKLFYHYMQDKTVDVRIIEDIQFEYVKGAKILCIPEMNGVPKDKYEYFLYQSGWYDTAFVHGEFINSIYREKGTQPGFDGNTPIFCLEHFCYCQGPIISGHVHTPGCFESYYYYTGSPYPWQFGEEEQKGFLLVLQNLDTRQHYVHFEPIKSFRYKTINLNDMVISDPRDVINYVTQLKEEGIDYIRVEITRPLNSEEIANIEVIKKYYKPNGDVKLKIDNPKKREVIEANTEMLDKYNEYSYITDKSLSPEEIFCRYVNQQENCEFITIEELKDILQNDI